VRVASDGVGLNVEVSGPDDGPPVVFLHGVAGISHTWSWLPPEITDGRRILLVDLRGHGASDRPGAYLLDDYAEDVAEILRTVARAPAVLVGHSLGGSIAWTVAQRHPELVAAAFLEDPPLLMGLPEEHAGNEPAKLFPLLRDRARGWQEAEVGVEAAAAEMAASPFGPDVTMGDVLLPDALLANARAQLAMDPEVLTGAAEGTTLAGTDLESPVGVPVLLLAAGVVPAFTTAHEERLARTHPGVEVVRADGAGHLIHDEIRGRDAFTERLAAFLAEHAPAGAGA
jgi:pimeloyl-ACP methyl ester carboxylesterase